MSQTRNRSRTVAGARRDASIVQFAASVGPAIQRLHHRQGLTQNQRTRAAEIRKNSPFGREGSTRPGRNHNNLPTRSRPV